MHQSPVKSGSDGRITTDFPHLTTPAFGHPSFARRGVSHWAWELIPLLAKEGHQSDLSFPSRSRLISGGPSTMLHTLMKETTNKLNIRYLGFETAVDGGRRLDFSVTAPGRSATRVHCDIPSYAFSGANRITFQESTALCYEKVRDVIEREPSIQDVLSFQLTEQDIQEFRPRPRHAVVRNK